MLINPQTLTLDANDRAVIAAALAQFADNQTRLANSRRTSPHAWQERVQKAMERNERDAARALDLLDTIFSVA